MKMGRNNMGIFYSGVPNSVPKNIIAFKQILAEAGRNRTYQRTCAALTHGFEDHSCNFLDYPKKYQHYIIIEYLDYLILYRSQNLPIWCAQ